MAKRPNKAKQPAAAPIESDLAGETKDEKITRLNFFSDAARAGLHSASLDIMEMMTAQGIPDAASCMLAGACQFIAELYEGIAKQTGADKGAMREHMMSSVGMYFDTYCEMSVKDALALAAGISRVEGAEIQ